MVSKNNKRKFQAYCIGTGKSGTHSIDTIFHNYNSCHELTADQLIDTLIDYWDGHLTDADLTKYVLDRDREFQLEMDSSQLNYHIIDILLDNFPDAKYILTIRDCYSWINSAINHYLYFPTVPRNPHWQNLRKKNHNSYRQQQYEKEEQGLKDLGLYPLHSYLHYWSRHNQELLEKIPKEKLLILKTKEITKKLHEVADFLDIPVETLSYEKSHSFSAPNEQKFDIIKVVGKEFVERQIKTYCSSLMNQFFPDFQLENKS